MKRPAQKWEFHAVTPERLCDLASFSESHGKFRYCSCMRWRMRSTDFQQSTKEERVAAIEGIVRDGMPIGVLAYELGEAVGWCSVAPKPEKVSGTKVSFPREQRPFSQETPSL